MLFFVLLTFNKLSKTQVVIVGSEKSGHTAMCAALGP